MRTTHRVITTVAALALSASFAMAAPQAQNTAPSTGTAPSTSTTPKSGHGHGWGGHHRRAMARHLAKKLNLTDAQKAQEKANLQAFFQTNKPLFEQARSTRQELRAAKQANDTAKVEALKASLQSQHAQFQQLRQQQQAQFESILTPDQKAQYEQILANRAARRAARNGK